MINKSESDYSNEKCPLCLNDKILIFHEDRIRSYFQCQNCSLVFVPKVFHLSPEDEKREYDLHNNNPEDEGYRRFLSRLTNPLQERIGTGAYGLDFGCGPGPTLSVMLEENGFHVDLYDFFYYKNDDVFDIKYDFITATEVVEHLHNPEKVFKILVECLNPGGVLGIMTKLVKNKEAFNRWHYIQDRTHVSFFSKETFIWLSKKMNMKVDFVGSDVILFEKL